MIDTDIQSNLQSFFSQTTSSHSHIVFISVFYKLISHSVSLTGSGPPFLLLLYSVLYNLCFNLTWLGLILRSWSFVQLDLISQAIKPPNIIRINPHTFYESGITPRPISAPFPPPSLTRVFQVLLGNSVSPFGGLL